ncbi:DMT family transporter [Paenibacillus sp. MWE-103]|uniref:DMT family transporter n=2 Tax=Paenibacillus artemisiicola TaxID=1172618 RepID=A0ABS3W9W3_9BACL|nr:DMT family transporter [Paenibacillus artemisiicola]
MDRQGKQLEASRNPFVLMPALLLMWGSLAAVSKLLLHRLDSYQVMFYMYGLGALAFLAILSFKGRLRAMASWTRSEFVLLLSCGALSFLYDFFYLKSLELVPAVEASMLNYLFPIFIVLFAIPIHREKMNRYKLLAVAMGFAGTMLLITKGNPANLHFTNVKGDLFAVLAAVSWGLFTNLIKKNRKDMLVSTFTITLVALVMSIGATFASSRFILPRPADFYGVLWLSMSNIVLGFFLYFRALKYSPASLVASFTFFTPFVTLVFIVVFVGEKLTVTDCLAAVLILFSVPIQKAGQLFKNKEKRLFD